jgi:hypothetical protein|tara:strand:- start:418 stop:780 length:363 start_codon:yes stop_codon:yes gene_type:complete
MLIMSSDRIKIIKRTKNGIIKQCTGCEKFDLTFNNIFLELSGCELKNLKEYIDNTDIEYWEKEYGSIHAKTIPIPTNQNNLILVFDRIEFEEFKMLLDSHGKSEFKSLSYKEISINFSDN